MGSEQWRDVVGYDGDYQVSSLGRVKSFKRNRELVLSLSVGTHGYVDAKLSARGRVRSFRVHRLVLNAFVGERPDMHACHQDGSRANNRLSNLRWDDAFGNMADKHLHGTNHNSNKTHCKFDHEFTTENTHWAKTPIGSGWQRKCRPCKRARDRRRSSNGTVP